MDKLELLKRWLETFPHWGEAQWELDLTGYTPVSCRLTMEDDRVTGRKEDVLGNSVVTVQTRFSLHRVSSCQEDPGRWADDFAFWVTAQSEGGLVPRLGQGITRLRPEKGKLEIAGDQAVYTVSLLSTYEKTFEVNDNNGKD